MKVLQINSDFRFGSTGKITGSLHDSLLQKGIDSYVCYGRPNEDIEPNTYSTISSFGSKFQHLLCNIFGDPYAFCYLSTSRVKKYIRQISPDIIHIQCINGYFVNIYQLIKWLATNNYKVVITLHAEFMYTGGCDHSYECEKWKGNCEKCAQKCKKSPLRNLKSWKIHSKLMNSFSLFHTENVRIVSVSKWLMLRAKESSIMKRFSHAYVLNGIDSFIFTKRENRLTCIPFSDNYLLFVTAMFNDNCYDNKGGKYIISIAKKLLDEKSDLKIVVVASYFNIKEKLPNNVVFLGRIKDQMSLSQLYTNASITLITSKRETYGMTVSESLMCGTPVVGFKAGAPESFALKDYSCFVDYGDIDALYDAIKLFLNKKINKDELSKIAISNYSMEKMVVDYVNIYKELGD